MFAYTIYTREQFVCIIKLAETSVNLEYARVFIHSPGSQTHHILFL